MIQAKAAGYVNSLAEMRQIIANSVPLDEFTPENKTVWDQAYQKFLTITRLNEEMLANSI